MNEAVNKEAKKPYEVRLDFVITGPAAHAFENRARRMRLDGLNNRIKRASTASAVARQILLDSLVATGDLVPEEKRALEAVA